MIGGGHRGSRKHILDWTGKTGFRDEINLLLDGTGATLGAEDLWFPKGYSHPDEAKLCAVGPEFLSSGVRERIADWWLVEKRGANVPNWDLLATCKILEEKGLVLVEAKAHETEFDWKGKRLASNASANSRANHARICRCIAEARIALREKRFDLGIDINTHYQLSNRVAFRWKLATEGISVVLMYLGFLGDTYFSDGFRDSDDWRRAWDRYIQDVLPRDFPETQIDCGKAAMRLIFRSRSVIAISV